MERCTYIEVHVGLLAMPRSLSTSADVHNIFFPVDRICLG